MIDSPLSQWLLEGYAHGELAPADQRRVEEALACSPTARRQLEDLARSNAEILAEYPATVMTQVVTRPAARPLGVPRLAWTSAFIVVLAVSFAIASRYGESERSKGGAPQLVVYRQKKGAVETLTAAEVVRPGDMLQLGYLSGGQKYGAILSIDGSGKVTQHWPVQGTMSARLTPRETLPFAYELDDAPSFERFFLLTSARPFALEPVLAAASKLAATESVATALLALDGVAELSVRLDKVSP